jgi:Fe-S cluster biogenesis protein NfuA
MKIRKKKTNGFADLDIDEKVTLVNRALESEVYMAMAMDGGGLEIMDIEGCTVKIRYFGACGNCPLGHTGTLQFIEYTLQAQVDPKIKVEIV